MGMSLFRRNTVGHYYARPLSNASYSKNKQKIKSVWISALSVDHLNAAFIVLASVAASELSHVA